MTAVRVGRHAVVTDTGRRRLGNEDAYVVKPPFFAIADGMGGARAGEVAARLAAAALGEAGAEPRTPDDIVALIGEANRRIWERSLADPETAGMGTTVTSALVDGAAGALAIGHVGDSRAYLYRDGALEQVTTDHSLVVELVESGVLTPDEAERHPQRSAITRAVGTEPSVEVDAFTVDALPGDLFLLCSDGLTDMLGADEIERIIGDVEAAPQPAADALVAAANRRGGEDNITVVLFELVADDAPPVDEASSEEHASAPAEAAAEVEPEAAEVETEAAEVETGGVAAAASPAPASDSSLSKHGAGPGGRLAALLLIVAILVLCALVVLWSLKR